jgi:hypothetical protein
MEKPVQKVVNGFLLAAVLVVPIKVQRQTCHSFCQDSDAGIHGSHLHSRSFCYGLTGSGAAHVEGVTASSRSILRLVPGSENACKKTHYSSPFN